MSEPRRLLFDESTPEETRALLRAWSEEQPSDAARRDALAALGLAAATIGVAAGAAKAGGSIAPKAAGAGVAALLKWLAIGAVATGASVTAVVYAVKASEPKVAATASAPLASAMAIAATNATTTAPATTTPTAPATTTPTAPATTTPTAPAITTATASAPATASTAKSTLADEVALLDRARAALAGGDSAGALRAVADYEARFPRGAFTQEAEVVHVDALARSGQRAAAQSAAKRFLAAYPSSPHAPRMRALVAGDAP